MANTTSAKKATRTIASRTAVNKARRSRVRGFIRKVEEAIAAGDVTVAAEALKLAQPEIQRAATKRSEEHTSELQSLMRISYAVFCLKKQKILHTSPSTISV